jgi:glycosyltransferase involved in cell wall biosynthesis
LNIDLKVNSIFNKNRYLFQNELPMPPLGRTGWPWTEEVDNSFWLHKRKEWPRVSIVMPSYNQGEFIEESLRSVLLQGYPDLEFFVYDGGSSDGSAEIIKKYEPWLTYWVSEKDRGQSDAINKGLRKSTGKYFNWQNSDDVLTPYSLFRAVNSLLEHPEASYAHGYQDIIYANGELYYSSESSYGPPTRLAPDVGDSIANLKTGTQPGCLMDRDLVVRVGGIDEGMHFVMDIDILLKLSVIKPPLYSHEKLVYYRYHQGTKSHGVWPKQRGLERIKIVQNLFRMSEAQQYLPRKREAMAAGHRYAADCSWMNNDISGFLYHLLMDIAWAPLTGWDRRQALLYFFKLRKKTEKIMQKKTIESS